MKFRRKIVTNDLTDRGFYMTDEGLVSLKNAYNDREFPVSYGHNWSDISSYIGKTAIGSADIVKEGADTKAYISALEIDTIIFEDTPQGKAYADLVRNGAPMGASVGIKIIDYSYDESSDLVYIHKAVPHEYSETPIPTDPNTIGTAKFTIVGETKNDLVASFSKWDKNYITNLPDSSFAVIEKDYSEGKCGKEGRHLPFRTAEGNIDLPHLRQALNLMTKITAVGESQSTEELRDIASSVLIPLAKEYLPASQWANTEDKKGDESMSLSEGFTKDFASNLGLGSTQVAASTEVKTDAPAPAGNAADVSTSQAETKTTDANVDLSAKVDLLVKENAALRTKMEEFMSKPVFEVNFGSENKPTKADWSKFQFQ